MLYVLNVIIIISTLVIMMTLLVDYFVAAESDGVRTLIKESEIQRMVVGVDSAIDADNVSTNEFVQFSKN